MLNILYLICHADHLDLQLPGLGGTGHIGLNEPGFPVDSRMQLIALCCVTRLVPTSAFCSDQYVPRHAHGHWHDTQSRVNEMLAGYSLITFHFYRRKTHD